jgi:cullin-associated NEDD8-dissociated protein 1
VVTGNKGQAKNEQDVKCWDDKSSIVVRVGDSCPCQQKKPDGTVQPQFWCCGGANHMDISYWWVGPAGKGWAIMGAGNMADYAHTGLGGRGSGIEE